VVPRERVCRHFLVDQRRRVRRVGSANAFTNCTATFETRKLTLAVHGVFSEPQPHHCGARAYVLLLLEAADDIGVEPEEFHRKLFDGDASTFYGLSKPLQLFFFIVPTARNEESFPSFRPADGEGQIGGRFQAG
jgi:hypothetical protein